MIDEWRELTEKRRKKRKALMKSFRNRGPKYRDHHEQQCNRIERMERTKRRLMLQEDKQIQREIRKMTRDMNSYKRLKRFNRLNECMRMKDQRALFQVVNTHKECSKNDLGQLQTYVKDP